MSQYYPNGIPREPYPPRSADEVRLASQMDRIEHKLDTLFAKLLDVEKRLRPQNPFGPTP